MRKRSKRNRSNSRRKSSNPFCPACMGAGLVQVRMRATDDDEERWVTVPCPYCSTQPAEGIRIPLKFPREPRIPTPRGSGRGQGGRISRGSPVPLHWEIRPGKAHDGGPVLPQYDERYRPPEKAIVERPKKAFPTHGGAEQEPDAGAEAEEESNTGYEGSGPEPEVDVTFTLGGPDESPSPGLDLENIDTGTLSPNPSYQIDVPADGYPGEANLDIAAEGPLNPRAGEPGSLRHDVLDRDGLGDDLLFDEPGAEDILS